MWNHWNHKKNYKILQNLSKFQRIHSNQTVYCGNCDLLSKTCFAGLPNALLRHNVLCFHFVNVALPSKQRQLTLERSQCTEQLDEQF